MAQLKAGKAGWAILQLVDSIEGTLVEDSAREIRRFFPDLQLYFPAARAGLIAKGHAFSTYCFVVCPENPLDLLRLERSFLVESVLREPSTRFVQRLSDKEMMRLIRQQEGDKVQVQDRVKITAGDWSGLEATVVELVQDKVKVLVELWSRRSVLELPRNEVTPV